ncbi:MAG: hypothetical protein PVF22_05620, partial [Candidatus Aminicenantes bacterium]
MGWTQARTELGCAGLSFYNESLTPIPYSDNCNTPMPVLFRTILAVSAFLLCSEFVFPDKVLPRNKYIRYLPLQSPQIVTQTQANLEFCLFGDTGNPSYQDKNPLDGIDDNRFCILEALAERFSPYLVQNTKAVPMNTKVYLDKTDSYPLIVDTWDVAREIPLLLRSEIVHMDTDDSTLLSLCQEFHPVLPQNSDFQSCTVNSEKQVFKVLYFDFPGHDEKSWTQEYEKLLVKGKTGDSPELIRTYVHPFILERKNLQDLAPGYEFILQYWFFYPFNDGGNNHEGDWEHINVVISPLERVESLLSADDIRSILLGKGLSDDVRSQQLVIKRVEYYFHHKVMVLDYSSPNVYLPEKGWKENINWLDKKRVGEFWIRGMTRKLAYEDEAEQRINTHPVGYIGGDNRGYDQILALPGPKNRDSHGTYPFPGVYKSVGPAEASEKISHYYNHKKTSQSLSSGRRDKPDSLGRGHIIRFDSPSRMKIIPDWERLIDLIKNNPSICREWVWLILPIRWGFPASPSPMAGVIPHTDTGNLSSVGPAHNAGWNRIHTGPGYTLFKPHRLSPLLPLDWQRHFQNRWGSLNGLFPTLLNMPPLDMAAQFLSSAFQLFRNRPTAVFTPKTNLNFRHLGFSGGAYCQTLPEDLVLFSFSANQV